MDYLIVGLIIYKIHIYMEDDGAFVFERLDGVGLGRARWAGSEEDVSGKT